MALSKNTKAIAAKDINQKLVNFVVNIRVNFIDPLSCRIIIIIGALLTRVQQMLPLIIQ
jgi:hypothetical protein